MKHGLRGLLVLMLLVLTAGLVVGCGGNSPSGGEAEVSRNYITAADLKTKLEKQEPLFMVDIQVEDEWAEGHIKGAIPTHAFPVDTDELQANIGAILPQLAGEDPVVVLCPRGKTGANRTYDYLKENGIAEERLVILEGGMAGWPYEELLVTDECSE